MSRRAAAAAIDRGGADKAPPHRLRSGLARFDRITVAALCLFASGWALIWAQAFSLLPALPVWLGIALCAAGLALIPFIERRR